MRGMRLQPHLRDPGSDGRGFLDIAHYQRLSEQLFEKRERYLEITIFLEGLGLPDNSSSVCPHYCGDYWVILTMNVCQTPSNFMGRQLSIFFLILDIIFSTSVKF